jgi:MFS family permease
MALLSLGCGDLRLATAGMVAGGAIAFPALTRLLPPGTLRGRRGLPAAVATVGLLGFAFFGAEAFVPLSLIEVRGQSTMVSGIALTAATIMWTTGAWMQARVAARRGRRQLTIGGLLLLIAGIAGVAIVLMPVVPVAIAALAWGIAGLGMGLAYSTTTLVVLESAPPGEEGAASSAAQLANVLGTALGTGIGGTLVTLANAWAAHSTRIGIALVDAGAIVAALLALLSARGLPARPPL